jgi:hypothetical protein
VTEIVLVVYRNTELVTIKQILFLVDHLQVRCVRLPPGLLFLLVFVIISFNQLEWVVFLKVLLRVKVEQSEARVDAKENLMVHCLAASQARTVSLAQLPFVEAN